MTLWVTVDIVDPVTGEVFTDPRVHLESQLGGPEVWRTEVWASEPIRRRGAVFLPVLGADDLCVRAEELPGFRNECEFLLADIGAVARELGHADGGQCIAFRLRNFLVAAERADPVRGLVNIR